MKHLKMTMTKNNGWKESIVVGVIAGLISFASITSIGLLLAHSKPEAPYRERLQACVNQTLKARPHEKLNDVLRFCQRMELSN